MRVRSSSRGAFTLIETALAITIVGVGVVATMQLFTSCVRDNQFAMAMTTGVSLAENIGEIVQGLPFSDPITGRQYVGPEPDENAVAAFDDVDDFFNPAHASMAHQFNPPLDAHRSPLSELAQYTQLVSVQSVDPMDPDSNASGTDISPLTYRGALRVKVRVLYRKKPTDVQQEVYRTSWVKFDR